MSERAAAEKKKCKGGKTPAGSIAPPNFKRPNKKKTSQLTRHHLGDVKTRGLRRNKSRGKLNVKKKKGGTKREFPLKLTLGRLQALKNIWGKNGEVDKKTNARPTG